VFNTTTATITTFNTTTVFNTTFATTRSTNTNWYDGDNHGQLGDPPFSPGR
jgi:hypothetical protein